MAFRKRVDRFSASWGHTSYSQSLIALSLQVFSNDDFSLLSASADCAIVWNRHSLSHVLLLDTTQEDRMADVTAALFVTGDRHVVLGNKAVATNESPEMWPMGMCGHNHRFPSVTIWEILLSCANKQYVVYVV